MKEPLKNSSEYRYSLQMTLILMYFLPVFAFSSFSSMLIPGKVAWLTMLVGLILSSLNTLFLLYRIQSWEQAIQSRAKTLVLLKTKKIQEESLSSSTTVVPQKPETQIITPQAVHALLSETYTSPYQSQPFQQSPNVAAVALKNHTDNNQLNKLKKALEEQKNHIVFLTRDIDEKHRELRLSKHQYDKKSQQKEHLNQELLTLQKDSKVSLKQKESLINEYQQTIVEQRGVIEKKHKHIGKLENKIRDLSYEVKTLLQMGDIHPPAILGEEPENHPLMNVFDTYETPTNSIDHTQLEDTTVSANREIHTPYDAAIQLQKYLGVSQKLRGIHNLSNENSRFSNISMENYTIDLRRLFDRFRNETTCTIIIYSLAEKRLLFVNDQIKTILGWSPEKFIKDFDLLIQKGKSEWHHAQKNLQHQSECQTKMLFKASDGNSTLIHCHLAIIPNESFRNHMIGVLYSNS